MAKLPLVKLCPDRASGTEETLFDPGDTAGSDADIALALVAYQTGNPTKLMGRGHKGAGPCADGLHTFILCDNLPETIEANRLDTEALSQLPARGLPSWEDDSVDNQANTYLGRYTIRQRAIWIERDRMLVATDRVVEPTTLKNGYREPSLTIMHDGKMLRARADVHPWRQLPAILASLDGGSGSPLTLQSHMHQTGDATPCIWTGAIARSMTSNKPQNDVAAVFDLGHIPDPITRSLYAQGVSHADSLTKKLGGSIRGYWDGVGANPPETKRHINSGIAQYWDRLNAQSDRLMEIAGTVTPDEDGIAGTEWGKICRRTVYNTYNSSCPTVSPNQYQSHAKHYPRLQG